jgi:hypothetical protein
MYPQLFVGEASPWRIDIDTRSDLGRCAIDLMGMGWVRSILVWDSIGFGVMCDRSFISYGRFSISSVGK